MSHASSMQTNGHVLRNVIGGMAGGLFGSWAMERAQAAMKHLAEGDAAPGGGGQQHREPETEPATYKAADVISRAVVGHDVPREYKPAAGALVHYAFGGAMGAIYGAAAARTPDVTAWAGLPFGATVWLIGDEMGVPLSGLSKGPTEYPVSDHAMALAAHLVYGVATEAVRRLIVKIA